MKHEDKEHRRGSKVGDGQFDPDPAFSNENFLPDGLAGLPTFFLAGITFLSSASEIPRRFGFRGKYLEKSFMVPRLPGTTDGATPITSSDPPAIDDVHPHLTGLANRTGAHTASSYPSLEDHVLGEVLGAAQGKNISPFPRLFNDYPPAIVLASLLRSGQPCGPSNNPEIVLIKGEPEFSVLSRTRRYRILIFGTLAETLKSVHRIKTSRRKDVDHLLDVLPDWQYLWRHNPPPFQPPLRILRATYYILHKQYNDKSLML